LNFQLDQKNENCSGDFRRENILFNYHLLKAFFIVRFSSSTTTVMGKNTTSTSHPVLIPWPCLYQDPLKPTPKPDCLETDPKPKKTFAQVISNVCDIPTSQLPQPVIKGEGLYIHPRRWLHGGIRSMQAQFTC